MNTLSEWIYQGQPLTVAPEDSFGFVYNITHIPTGQAYIGKKQFWSHLTKKVKGRKNRVHFKKESDWKTYWSSSAVLKELVNVDGKESFTREVLNLCNTKSDLSYAEVEQQIKRDVLTACLEDGRAAYLNGNILNRFFRKPSV